MQNNEQDNVSLRIINDILKDDSWRFKMNDLSFEYAVKVFFHTHTENDGGIPAYLAYEYKNPKDTGDFVSEDGTEILYVRKEYKKYTHEEIEDMFTNLQSLLSTVLWDFQAFILEDIEKRVPRIVKEETYKTVSRACFAMKMLYNNENKSRVSEITGIPLNKLNMLEEFINKKFY